MVNGYKKINEASPDIIILRRIWGAVSDALMGTFIPYTQNSCLLYHFKLNTLNPISFVKVSFTSIT